MFATVRIIPRPTAVCHLPSEVRLLPTTESHPWKWSLFNRVCGSGLQAVVHADEAIRVGYRALVIAGGTESMSNAPYLLDGASWGYRMGDAKAIDSVLTDGLTCAICSCHMGVTAEEVASRFGVSREDQMVIEMI